MAGVLRGWAGGLAAVAGVAGVGGVVGVVVFFLVIWLWRPLWLF